MKSKRIITFLGLVCMLALALSIPSTVVAGQKNDQDGNSGNGCKLQGTWIGETLYPLAGGPSLYSVKFFVVYHGTGDTEGTEVSEWINPVPAPLTSWSNARGVWLKSGPHKYNYTKLGYIFNIVNGDIVQVLRHTGTLTMTGCNTILLDSVIQFLNPDMTPVMCLPLKLTIHRILPAEPCQAP